MIAIFHTIYIIARYVCVALSESILAQIKEQSVDELGRTLSPGRNKYQVPPCDSEFEEGYGLRFYPQVYVQRYCSVKAVLEDERWKGKIRKVVDFGCAEFGFFPYLKRLTGVQEILEVDVARDILEQHYCRVSPLNSDYLSQRNEPLTVFVLEGSIANTDELLIGCDAVVCIELIEHVYPDVLEEIPYTVFGFIKPLVAIFTTPNREFNVLFPRFESFRHPDHKFEWTRSQFENWANNISIRYPDYEVSFHDIGWGPKGTEDLGACSQMAVFANYHLCTSERSRTPIHDMIDNTKHKYNLLRKTEYPFHVDSRSDREKLRDQVEYSIRMFSASNEWLEDGNNCIPLSRLLPFVSKWTSSEEELEEIVRETNWKLVTHQSCLAVVLPTYDSSVSEEESEISLCQYELIAEEEKYESKNDNWNNVDSSEEKWDCDSLDYHVQNSDLSSGFDKSMSIEHGVSVSQEQLAICDHEIEGKCSPSTSQEVSALKVDYFENESTSVSINMGPNVSKDFASSSSSKLNIRENSKCLHFQKTKLEGHNCALCDEDVSATEDYTCCNIERKHNSFFRELPEDSDKQKCCGDTYIVNSNSSIINKEVIKQNNILLNRTSMANGKCSLESHHTDVPLHFFHSSSDETLYLKLQIEAHDTVVEMSKKHEGPSDSPAAASNSLEEPNDKLADSGYPNSTSAQDMELDLTPEQVDELFTENDVITDHVPDHHSDSISVSSQDSDSVSEQEQPVDPAPVLLPQPDILFEEAMNVENGDVANNNRDGEGNNALAVGAHPLVGQGNAEDDNAMAVGIVLPENLDDLIPLFAAAEDMDNDNEIEINVVEPFPPWLLNLLGLANGGGAHHDDAAAAAVGGEDAGGDVEGGDGDDAVQNDIQGAESSEEGDSENNHLIDEGLGDENNIDNSSISDTCPSEVGLEVDSGGEIMVADP